jgi:hypothetical protein
MAINYTAYWNIKYVVYFYEKTCQTCQVNISTFIP